jgi:hypothetical protein
MSQKSAVKRSGKPGVPQNSKRRSLIIVIALLAVGVFGAGMTYLEEQARAKAVLTVLSAPLPPPTPLPLSK